MEKGNEQKKNRLQLAMRELLYQMNPFATTRRGESDSQEKKYQLSRRDFLKVVGAGVITHALPEHSKIPDSFSTVEENIDALLQNKDMALELKRFDSEGKVLYEYSRKSDELFPVASTFKLFVALYYFINTPQSEWKQEEGSDMHSMIVFSNNGKTGDVLAEVSSRVPGEGNAIEKFNDFLHEKVGMQKENGIARWDAGALRAKKNTDEKVTKDPNSKAVNFLTTEDIIKGLSFLATAESKDDWEKDEQFQAAIKATRALASLPSPEYQSVLDRVAPFSNGYGKDGILRPSDIGISVFTEGCVYPQSDGGSLVVAYMAKRQTEPTLRLVLKQVLDDISRFETRRNLRARGGSQSKT